MRYASTFFFLRGSGHGHGVGYGTDCVQSSQYSACRDEKASFGLLSTSPGCFDQEIGEIRKRIFFAPFRARDCRRTTNFSHAGWSRTRCTTQLGHVHTGSSPNARSATHATMFWLDKRHGGQRGRRSVTAKAIDALCRQRGLCSPAMSRRARRSLAAMSLTTRGATSAMRRGSEGGSWQQARALWQHRAWRVIIRSCPCPCAHAYMYLSRSSAVGG